MKVLHSLCAGLTAVSIVGIIVWGASSCSQQDALLREACIKGGGSVVSAGMNGNFHCLRVAGQGAER